MIRTILTLVLAVGTLDAAGALRVLEQPEAGFELGLGNVDFPTSTTGSVKFKTCDTCSTVARSVTNATRYYVNNQELALADFLLAAANIRTVEGQTSRSMVGVYVDVQSQNVNRVFVQQPRR